MVMCFFFFYVKGFSLLLHNIYRTVVLSAQCKHRPFVVAVLSIYHYFYQLVVLRLAPLDSPSHVLCYIRLHYVSLTPSEGCAVSFLCKERRAPQALVCIPVITGGPDITQQEI